MSSKEWTFGQRMAGGFTAAAVILGVVALFGHRSSAKLIENERLLQHSQAVREEAVGLLSALKDAETGQRGYTITGNEAFLEPYTRAMPGIEKAFESLRLLTLDDPEQQQHLAQLHPLMVAKVNDVKRVVELRRTSGFEAARQLVATSHGKELMDQLRASLELIDQNEAGLQRSRFAQSKADVHVAQVVMLWGGLIGIIFIILLGVYISRNLSREISKAVGHIQGSSAALQSAAHQQATGSREQATSMSEISSTINEMLATSRQIAESAKRVALISLETSQSAAKGEQTVVRASDSVVSIRKQVDLIVGHMLDLGKKSQQIGGILEIVNELSDQTNILSINASVEAAGAGEAGRRFAVVADEIRKLADRVGASTKEIRGLVEEMRSAVNTTVMSTEGGAKAAEAGTKQLSELSVSFQGILGQVTTSSEAAREIELSTKQQAIAVEQVTIAITGMSQASRSTETSASLTLKTAVELSQLSKDLARLVQTEVRT